MSKPLRRLLILACLGTFACAGLATAEDWSHFWPRFRTAIVQGNRKAVADRTQFPFSSYELVGKVPAAIQKRSEGGPIALSRAEFLRYFRTLFDARAVKILRAATPVLAEADSDLAGCAMVKYAQGRTSEGRGWYAWLLICRDEQGAWTLRRTDNVSE